jgi:hypothetical protein
MKLAEVSLTSPITDCVSKTWIEWISPSPRSVSTSPRTQAVMVGSTERHTKTYRKRATDAEARDAWSLHHALKRVSAFGSLRRTLDWANQDRPIMEDWAKGSSSDPEQQHKTLEGNIDILVKDCVGC